VTEHAPGTAWQLLKNLAEHETNGVVLSGACLSLVNMIGRDKENGLRMLKMLFDRLPAPSEKCAFRSFVVNMATDFAVCDDEPWAVSVMETWRAEAINSAPLLSLSGRRLVEYLTPQRNVRLFSNARALLLQHLDAVAAALRRLRRLPSIDLNDVLREGARQLYDVIDHTVSRIFFSADTDPNLRWNREIPLSDDARKRFFIEVLPLLKTIVAFALDEQSGILFAGTAHYFMQLLNGVLKYDPSVALGLAADVVRSSKPHGYNLDSLAMNEVVKLVEAILADHRSEIHDADSIKSLLNLLDAFIEAGWPEALQLVWRLDEIYR
jgi:hypothetical protein